MKVTDMAEIDSIVKKSNGKIIKYTGRLSDDDYNKLLCSQDFRYKRASDGDILYGAISYNSPTKYKDKAPIYSCTALKEGNFGKEGHEVYLMMEPDEDGLYSKNLTDSSIIYWDTHLIKLLNEQIEKNKVYYHFTDNDITYLIRKEHYEEILQKFTDLILKIISNHTKFTYGKIKNYSNLKDAGVLMFFLTLNSLVNTMTPLLLINKKLSKKYYDKIQSELTKVVSKFDKLYSKIMTLQKLIQDDLNEFYASIKDNHKILFRYYDIYHDLLSREELFKSINEIDINTFMINIFPKLNFTKDDLADDRNKKVKKYLEDKIKKVVNKLIPLPKSWGALNYKVEIEDLDSTILMSIVNSDTNEDECCEDAVGC